MTTSSLNFKRHGDKENSAFFEEYLQRLLEERDNIGLSQMIFEIDALILTVEPGHGISYLEELCLMSSYHYLVTLETEKHWTHLLRIDLDSPDILIREVKYPDIKGIFRCLNEVYPIGSVKPNARYIGEVVRVNNAAEVVELQKQRGIRFFDYQQVLGLELPENIHFVKPSPYTHNILGYLERKPDDLRVYKLGQSSIYEPAQQAYLRAKDLQKSMSIEGLILPIDHLATRIYSQNREVALLEYLTLTSYYYWGAYNIFDQNSSTNITKSIHFEKESKSPAKVFTANNVPYFVTHLDKLPSPTENFVRNYGPRLHHIAFAVQDGEVNTTENIEYVVNALTGCCREFLLDVTGSKAEGLKQIFSTASDHSSLIIEYVQRFNNFQGFFTKDNVAELTFAAGVEEELNRLHKN